MKLNWKHGIPTGLLSAGFILIVMNLIKISYTTFFILPTITDIQALQIIIGVTGYACLFGVNLAVLLFAVGFYLRSRWNKTLNADNSINTND